MTLFETKPDPMEDVYTMTHTCVRRAVCNSEVGIEDPNVQMIIRREIECLKEWQKKIIRRRWTYKRWDLWMTQYNYTPKQMRHIFFVMMKAYGGRSSHLSAYNYISLELLLNDRGMIYD